MPSDPLDGIKTYRGRVVYDREKHPWDVKDVIRILKSFNPKLAEKTTCSDIYSSGLWLLNSLLKVMSVLAQDECAMDISLANEILIMLKTIETNYGIDFGFGGGAFGGAGASRRI